MVALRYGALAVDLPNMPVAQVRNYAASKALGTLLAFVDADHILDKGWLTAAVSAISEQNVAAVGFPCNPPTEGNWVQLAYDRFRSHPETRSEVEWLGGGNLLVQRDVFASIGGFDESLETCEDVDLCQRIRRTGRRILAEPGMASIHLGDPRTLRGIFFGELWRGRGNLKVTLRGPLKFCTYASLLIPCINLFLTAVALASLLLLTFRPAFGLIVFVACMGLFASLVLIRAARMTGPTGITSFMQNLTVALVYEMARSLALICRSTHAARARHRSSGNPTSKMDESLKNV
jgi:GT2 family glycosyltransferase